MYCQDFTQWWKHACYGDMCFWVDSAQIRFFFCDRVYVLGVCNEQYYYAIMGSMFYSAPPPGPAHMDWCYGPGEQAEPLQEATQFENTMHESEVGRGGEERAA